MKKIYIYRDQVNSMDKDSLYLVFQSTRVLNTIKFFNKLLKEKEPSRRENDLKSKEFIELLLFNASSLWEVLDLINKDLANHFEGKVKKELNERLCKIRDRVRNGNDDYCKILKDIRNKHSYHIAYDEHYAPSFLTDEPSRYDLKIGILLSTNEEDIVYTLEDEILMSYLMREYEKTEDQIFDLIIDSIAYFERELLDLFNNVLFDLVERRAYIM